MNIGKGRAIKGFERYLIYKNGNIWDRKEGHYVKHGWRGPNCNFITLEDEEGNKHKLIVEKLFKETYGYRLWLSKRTLSQYCENKYKRK